MPYIKEKDREKFDKIIDQIKDIDKKGELEYCIFRLMKIYMTDKEQKYSTIHDCTYAAQHCADEFRRRFLDKREDDAIKLNGDIE